ncbi:MAG: hypothetical protein AABX17_04035 [Nanoarchaeota archaeon]
MKKINKRANYVYVVGDSGPEHNFVLSIHKSYGWAIKAWNKLRQDLIKDAKRGLQYAKEEAKKNLKKGKWDYNSQSFSEEDINHLKNTAAKGDEMYLEMIKNLSCKSPEKMDNYPQDTPYIKRYRIQN